jgi:hypothetical protein
MAVGLSAAPREQVQVVSETPSDLGERKGSDPSGG